MLRDGDKLLPHWLSDFIVGFFGTLLLVLYLLALLAAFNTLQAAAAGGFKGASQASGSLGAGAVIVAVLGAPFLVWRTVTAHRDVEFKKEGHITDRITKSVEQLGAEKTLTRLGRAVQLYEGEPTEETIVVEEGKAHNILGGIEVNGSRIQRGDGTDEIRVQVWPRYRVIIDYGDRAINEMAGSKKFIGEPQSYSETYPNLEIRVGAIFALERIAQDSSRYDGGRDHPRVMEILAAYVRENSKVEYQSGWKMITSPRRYRIDLQAALDVIGRRTRKQRQQERISGFRINLQAGWYVNASFDGGDFSNVVMIDSHFRGATFYNAVLTDTWFARSLFEDCDFSGARLRRTHFPNCTFSGQSDEDRATPFSGHIESILLHGAQLPNLDSICLRQHRHKVFGSSDTRLGSTTRQLQKSFKDLQIQRYDVRSGQVSPPGESLIEAPVAYWSPFDAGDAITDVYRDNFLSQPFVKDK